MAIEEREERMCYENNGRIEPCVHRRAGGTLLIVPETVEDDGNQTVSPTEDDLFLLRVGGIAWEDSE